MGQFVIIITTRHTYHRLKPNCISTLEIKMHNRSDYNFACNEGGLLKFVWNIMFSNGGSSSNNGNRYGSYDTYQGQHQQSSHQQQHQQQHGIGSSSAGNNQFQNQNQATDGSQMQRGKG